MANHTTQKRAVVAAPSTPRSENARFTLTEALAEIKTLTRRIQKKRDAIQSYLARQATMADPFHAEGGTPAFITREQEQIETLEERIIELRRAVFQANLSVEIVIGQEARSLQDWLTWREEVAFPRQRFLQTLARKIAKMRQDALARGTTVMTAVTAGLGAPAATGVIVNVNERELVDELDALDTTLGQLNGQLYLKNATTQVAVGA